MTALHHHDRPSPSTWSGELVQRRLADAYTVERKMPGEYHHRMTSAWLATPTHTFADMVGWDNPGDTARDRNWENWERAKAALPIEVSMMEEARDWLPMLPNDERQCLDAWAKCEAYGIPVARVRRKIGFSKTTFYRKVNDASQRIASRLNREGVQVR